MLSSKISIRHQKSIIKNIDKYFCHHQKCCIKNTFKVALQYLFKVFILFNTVFYLIFNLKLQINPKMCAYKNLKDILKAGENLLKVIGNPVFSKT